jgi:hypothetical protein
MLLKIVRASSSMAVCGFFLLWESLIKAISIMKMIESPHIGQNNAITAFFGE